MSISRLAASIGDDILRMMSEIKEMEKNIPDNMEVEAATLRISIVDVFAQGGDWRIEISRDREP